MDQKELIIQSQVIDKHERPITCLTIESRKQFSFGSTESGSLQEGYNLFSASEDGIVYQWLSQLDKVRTWRSTVEPLATNTLENV
jgi:hypothetical protein